MSLEPGARAASWRCVPQHAAGGGPVADPRTPARTLGAAPGTGRDGGPRADERRRAGTMHVQNSEGWMNEEAQTVLGALRAATAAQHEAI